MSAGWIVANGRRVPSPAEIRRLCQRIQAGWTPQERARRAAWSVEAESVETPRIELFGAAKAIIEHVDP